MKLKMAEWIAGQMDLLDRVDDVYDVLLGNITKPDYFVDEVKYHEQQYLDEVSLHEAKLRRHNV